MNNDDAGGEDMKREEEISGAETATDRENEAAEERPPGDAPSADPSEAETAGGTASEQEPVSPETESSRTETENATETGPFPLAPEQAAAPDDTAGADEERASSPSKEDQPADPAPSEQARRPEPPPKIVGVKFKRAGKTYHYNPMNLMFNIGEQVIVETDRGLGIARVVTPPLDPAATNGRREYKKVIRKANWNDIERDRKNRQREMDAARMCTYKIRERNLQMKLVRVEYLHDASKAIFYFTAEQRVDFRDLVKDLARQLHTRIEMRQIGVRDESKIVGGIGPCGREVCCSTFLTDFSPVSVRMAKDQNLAMNPSKVSGLCGRLMCCLAYEHNLYRDMIKRMPKKGKSMVCRHGECRVLDLDILAGKVLVEIENGKTETIAVDKLWAPGEEPPPDVFEDDVDLDDEMLESDDPSVLERIGGGRQNGRKGQPPQKGREGGKGREAGPPKEKTEGKRGRGPKKKRDHKPPDKGKKAEGPPPPGTRAVSGKAPPGVKPPPGLKPPPGTRPPPGAKPTGKPKSEERPAGPPPERKTAPAEGSAEGEAEKKKSRGRKRRRKKKK